MTIRGGTPDPRGGTAPRWADPAAAARSGRAVRPRGSDRAGRSDRSAGGGISLTAPGAVLLMFVAGALGAFMDLLLGPVLGLGTLVMLAAGSVLACWLVRRRGLLTVVFAAPLVYLAVSAAAAALAPTLSFSAAGIAAGVVFGFPAMAVATALAVVIAALRQVTGR